MAGTLKKVVITLGTLAGLGLAGLVALFFFIVHRDDAAKAQATALCAPALVGSPTTLALERARQSGATNRDPHWVPFDDEGGEQLVLAFPAALPLTGYLCRMEARDGVVATVAVEAID